MNYKDSLLIYKAQTFNERKIYNSKKRLIKSLTPIVRKLKCADFLNIEEYKNESLSLLTTTNDQLQHLIASKATTTDSLTISNIEEQICDLKILFLEKKELLNRQYKNDKIQELETYSKYLLLTYCTWSEASYIKLKHTPHGLPLNERFNTDGTNIELKWKNLIDTIINKIPPSFSGDIIQIKSELKEISERYIVNNSYLRNKIAHGQWQDALNSNNTNLNLEVSQNLSFIDFVKIDSTFEIHHKLIEILENICESNDTSQMVITKHNSYLYLKEQLDILITKYNSWDLASRHGFLNQRTIDTKIFEIAKKLKNKEIDSEIIFEVTGVSI